MKIIMETSLENFEAWSGGRDTLNTLKEKDLCDRLESILECEYPDGMTDTELNDLLWFEDDAIAEWLGFSDWEDLENDGEEEEEEADTYAEGKELLDYCVGEELKFQAYCDKASCSMCPFNCHTELQTDCEEAYGYMLRGHNFDEAIALLNGEEV